MLTIHIVPNAHLDPAWLWDWREGLNEAIATCRTVVELMEEQRDVTFTRNEAFIYRHVERYDPKLFERIRWLVKAGRWEIAGGAMLQPDTNLGSGEAYVRQYLYGQAYFRRRFGIVPEVAYQVDSFGHAAGLPAIYRAAGCRYAVQCRPSQKERPTSSRIFRWRGPDGSEILTVNLESYGLEFETQDPGFTFSARLARAREQAPRQARDWLLLAGFGDHGGGLNRQLLAEIRETMAHPPSGCVLRFSTLREFFARIEPRRRAFPIVKGELQYNARGCYTSAASIKRAYAEAERLVTCAERWSAVADVLGKSRDPSKPLAAAWRDVLFNQFHDILPGSSIERVCNEALDHLGRARHAARELANDAALPVGLAVNTAAREGVPVLLFNSRGVPFDGPVEVEWFVEYRPFGPLGPNGEPRVMKQVRAFGPDGRAVPTQFLPTECVLPSEWRYRSVFQARVPACGYAVYWLQRAESAVTVDGEVTVERGKDITIANEFLRLTHRNGSGGVQVLDLKHRRRWFDGPAGVGLVLDDPGDSWGAGVHSWRKVLGAFRTVEARVVDRGPLKASLRLIGEYGNSRLIQEFSIHAGSRRVHCQVRLLWNEPRSFLKLEFPIRIRSPRYRFATPYAIVERRADEGEMPANPWAAVVGTDGRGIGVAGQGPHGFDVANGRLRMSVVRSPWYGSQGVPPRNAPYERPSMDLGLHCFEYVLVPYDEITPTAGELNLPLHVTHGFRHPGRLPPAASVIAVVPAEVELAAFKQAEDGHGWIVRLWESRGRRRKAVISVLGRKAATIRMGPWQLRTLRLERKAGRWNCTRDHLTE